MESQSRVLLARRRALAYPLAISPPSPVDHLAPMADPFAVESHGFFLSTPSLLAPVNNSPSTSRNSTLQPPSVENPPAVVAKIEKATGKRQRRFVSNWTPEMDKIVRKALTKHGWGCWSRIASSGKLPKQYTAKMISNRARSIGLNRDMFGPAVIQTVQRPRV